MKRRFDRRNSDGVFVDRHGYELGRLRSIRFAADGQITSMTIETVGDYRGASSSPTTNEGGKEETPQRDGGLGETPAQRTVRVRVDRVWATYVAVHKPRDKTLHPEEARIIRDALQVASADECCLAVAGCGASAWHMGDNPQSRKYNRLSQVLRGRRASQYGSARTTRETVDFFIEQYERSGRTFGFTSEVSAKIEVLKDRVRRRTTKAVEAMVTLREDYGIEAYELSDGRWDFERDAGRGHE